MEEYLKSLSNPFSAVLSVFLLISASVFWGAIVLKKILKLEFRLPLHEIIIHFTTGLNFTALAAIILFHLSVFSPVFYWIFFALSACGGIFFIYSIGKEINFSSILLYLLPFIVLVLPVFIFVFSAALCLPAGWDEMTYHITLPLQWIKDSFPSFRPDIPYSGFPAMPETVYTLLIITGGMLAPRILTWFLMLTVSLSLFLLLRKNRRTFVQSTLVLAFSLSPVALMLYREAFAEAFILVNITGTLLLLKTAANRNSNSFGIMMGAAVFAAGALAVKLTGFATAAAIYILFEAKLQKSKPRSGFLLYFILAVFVLSFPFYARAWALSSSPFYPFFGEYLSDSASAGITAGYHHAMAAQKFGIHTLPGFFAVPILTAFRTATFDGSFGLQFIVILFLSLLAFIRSLKGNNTVLKSFFAATALIYILWFFSAQQARFLLPAFILLLPPSLNTLRSLPRWAANIICLTVLIFSLISLPARALDHYYNCWKHVCGAVSFSDYLYTATGKGYLKAVDFIRRTLPPESGIMLVYENRKLYMPGNCIVGTPFYQAGIFTPPPSDKSQLISDLESSGTEYLLLFAGTGKNPDIIPEYLQKCRGFNRTLTEAIRSGMLAPVWNKEGYYLYKVQGEGKENAEAQK